LKFCKENRLKNEEWFYKGQVDKQTLQPNGWGIGICPINMTIFEGNFKNGKLRFPCIHYDIKDIWLYIKHVENEQIFKI